MFKSEFPIKALIMCGGKGTRMWPISNLGHPKQFESFLGKKSMFRQTIDRVLKGFRPEDIYISTNQSFSKDLLVQAPEIPQENFILEPAMRDNLGAIALATAVINHRHPDSVMVILWGADHVVQKEAEFLSAIHQAADLAKANDLIVHVDTPPTYPSVHNGWIEVGNEIKVNGLPAGKASHKIFEFIRQVEKPDEPTAKKFLASKKYLIHTGYMATKPSLLLNYYQKYAPEAYKILEPIQAAIDTPQFNQVLDKEYPKFAKQSVDCGLFEKLPRGSQWELPAGMGWIDVGTWELLYHGLPKDKQGNVVIGQAYLMDVNHSLVVSKALGQVGLIGLENMIVVDTEQGLLVCPLSEAPKVKQLYNALYVSKD
ncbi:MAG: sugar phosphate nucleotidyltransferase [Candidatus Beckwithbacteria bacterium]|nr:sugar phosphate nucleotidyltransferase [Candidatus Beckwithbacteria bacterium]